MNIKKSESQSNGVVYCRHNISLLKSNSMGMFDEELAGLEGKERRNAYKRLHIAKKRAVNKTNVNKQCTVKVRLDPSSEQAELLRYFANCSTYLYELMVNIWKDDGSPPKQKKDFWKQ